uniref:(+)-piperitol/(+)-sesamin synthase n=1 Tax=Scoparia dulcis TaxID=107240 RepID=A0A1W7HBU1_SCODU
METSMWLYAFLSLFFLVLAFKFSSKGKRKLPPSPFPAIPFLGHLHLLKLPLHRTYHEISQKLGPIFSFRVGNRFMVVVSSPSLVEECFTKNDTNLANRPRLIVGKHIFYNYTALGVSPYGEHWRNLRRLTAVEVVSPTRLNVFKFIRHDEIRLMLEKLYKGSKDGFARVELRSILTEMTFNNIMRMVAGKRYFGEQKDSQDDEKAKKFRDLIADAFRLSDTSNPADFFPFLRWLDYGGYEKSSAKTGENMDIILQEFVDEHRLRKGEATMIDHLLSLQEAQPEYYTDTVIKGLIMVILFGATDTSALTLEWAMSALLNHPEKLEKARAQIDELVGNDRLLNESDLNQLPYIQNIISETYRLFPVAPLLIPHESSADCKIGGYDIPAGTIFLVNAWTVHRDPTVWDDPTSFKPERFEAGEVGPPKLMPFGMGKRSCPGIGLAQRVVGLALGSLIQCFDWKRMDEAQVDLTEGIGASMPKAIPLEARCKSRDILHNVLP